MADDKIADLSAALVMTPVAWDHWLVILPVALCIGLGAVLLMLRDRVALHGRLAVAGLALLVAVDAALLWRVACGGPLTMVMGRWLPPFGIAFTVDLLGAALALTSAIVAFAAGLYALADTPPTARRYGFFPLLMMLMAGVSGAFLTGDLFNLYVWFEVLLISSFGLLILGSERRQIDGGLKYAVLNLVGTTLFLVAVGYLYAISGTLNMADIALRAGTADASAPLMTLSALFLLAFCMKAAAFPVNFWLPASYHTPGIAVSALFAGLLTKVGIYAMLRIMVMLLPMGREALAPLIGLVAIATMISAAFGALAETDMRRLLGYIVISGIGTMLAGVAVGGEQGLGGAILYALNSMVLMAALYLAIGLLGRLSGSYSLITLAGLWRRSGWFSALSLVLFFAACGLPPFSGFWPKVMLLKAALDTGHWWLAGAMLITGLLTTIIFGRVFLLAYWRPVVAGAAAVSAVPSAPAASLGPVAPRAVVSVLVLASLVVGFGLFPERLVHLARLAAAGLVDPGAYVRSVFPEGAGP